MLSSITPLGERGRNRNWSLTVTWFTMGALIAGATVFGLAGWAGQALGLPGGLVWVGIGLLAAAAIADAAGLRPPGPRRQVDENWLGEYRGWVVGLGYGLQLGSGFATIVPAYASWGLLILASFVGPQAGLLAGVAFGLGRSLLVISGGRILTTAALTRRLQQFNRWQQATSLFTVAAQVAVIFLAVQVRA